MKIWKMFGRNLNDILVEAENFDEALMKARLVHKNYVGGQLFKVIE